MPRNKLPIAEDFLGLQLRLAEWRGSHRPRSPLPEEFWTAAVALARVHGLHRTARTLPIDYAGLRKRFAPASRPNAVARPEFLELFAAPPAQSGACVEILRVQWSGSVNWSELLRAWRQGER